MQSLDDMQATPLNGLDDTVQTSGLKPDILEGMKRLSQSVLEVLVAKLRDK